MPKKKRRSAAGRFFYALRYRVGERSLRGFVDILPYLPARLVRGYTRIMARLTYALLWSYRKRM